MKNLVKKWNRKDVLEPKRPGKILYRIACTLLQKLFQTWKNGKHFQKKTTILLFELYYQYKYLRIHLTVSKKIYEHQFKAHWTRNKQQQKTKKKR